MAGAIAATVILGAAGIGAQIGSARRQNRQAREAEQMTREAMDRQNEQQQRFDALGRPMVEQGQQNTDIVQQYLRRLASGDRSLTMQELAPNINSMLEQSRGAVAAQRNMMPRGGAQAAASAHIPQQLQGNINNLMFGARSDAMNRLGTLGNNQVSLGLGAMGQGAGLTNSMLQYGLQAREQAFNQGMQSGQGMVGYLDFINRMFQQYRANSTPNAGMPTSANAMPSNQLANFGQGSMLGFGGRAPQSTAATQSGQGSTYSLYNSNNVYGGSTG